MSWVAYAILLLAVAWILQIVGTYFQMRHYREVLGHITREGGEGYVGVGNAKATFGKGVVLILVADENDVVRRALRIDRKSTRLNSSHANISYAVFCLK